MSTAITLRRVTPASGDEFYLGVYETPIGNVANLLDLTAEKVGNPWVWECLAPLSKSSTDVYRYLDVFKPTGYEYLNDNYPFAKLAQMIGERFGVQASLPSSADLVAVGAGSATTENPQAGHGYGRDTAIDKEMVIGSDSSNVANNKADAMKADPYGFYGIWGSYWEACTNGYVGSSRKASTATCYSTNIETGANFITTAAFRPKVAVEKPVTVTVEYRVGEATTKIGTVEVAPGKPLFADFEKATPVRAGYTFLRWELDGKASHVGRRPDDRHAHRRVGRIVRLCRV